MRIYFWILWRYKYPYDKLKETLQEFLTGSEDEDKIISDCCEALIGAIFIDL